MVNIHRIKTKLISFKIREIKRHVQHLQSSNLFIRRRSVIVQMCGKCVIVVIVQPSVQQYVEVHLIHSGHLTVETTSTAECLFTAAAEQDILLAAGLQGEVRGWRWVADNGDDPCLAVDHGAGLGAVLRGVGREVGPNRRPAVTAMRRALAEANVMLICFIFFLYYWFYFTLAAE